jgi:rSAM/selenodomain-associated transferase 1
MAKAPIPGRVKTRLSPPLTPNQAAALNVAFLRDTSANLAAVAERTIASPVVSYTPAGEEHRFEGILPPEFELIVQRGEDFGERLLYAAEDLLACGFSAVCLIDSDSPTVPKRAYVEAVLALQQPGARVVLGPSADGGYYLIGIKRADARLFEGVSWSTSDVYSQTVERVHAAGLELVELPMWYDVDDAATLSQLRAELLAGIAPGFAIEQGYVAPATRALLEQMSAAYEPLATDKPDGGGAADDPVEGAQRPLDQAAFGGDL